MGKKDVWLHIFGFFKTFFEDLKNDKIEKHTSKNNINKNILLYSSFKNINNKNFGLLNQDKLIKLFYKNDQKSMNDKKNTILDLFPILIKNLGCLTDVYGDDSKIVSLVEGISEVQNFLTIDKIKTNSVQN